MIQKWITNKGFVNKYLEYMNNFATSTIIDFWSAIWILSSLSGRNVIIDRPNNPLYCNLFLNFIYKNDNLDRNLSINVMNRTLEKLNKDNLLLDKPVYIYDLINRMINHQQEKGNMNINFIIKDFSNSIYKNKFYNLINTLYYNPNERSYHEYTYTDKSTYNHYTSLCTSDTFDDYIKALENGNYESGLPSKLYTIIETNIKSKPGWGITTEESKELLEYGKRYVQKTNKEKRYILSAKAIRRYNQWYGKRRISDNGINKLFEIYEPELVLKLATILYIDDDNLDNEITESYIENAINILKYTKNQSIKEINKLLNKAKRDDFDKIIIKIRRILIENQSTGVMHNKLFQNVKSLCNKGEFKYIISILHELELIEMYMTKNGGYLYKITDTFYNKLDIRYINKLLNKD